MKNTERGSSHAGGMIIHHPRFYDLMAWITTSGREGSFREQLLDLALLERGESVLDAGCGTGTLAIAAKRRVGPAGSVSGIDASPEMIARAEAKARKAGAEVAFKNEPVEELPFPDGSFDVVLSTVMLHHLTPKLRERGVREMRRVLKPGGRLLIVDFRGTAPQKGLMTLIHRRHGHVDPAAVVALLGATGLHIAASGPMGFKDLYFARAIAPGGKP